MRRLTALLIFPFLLALIACGGGSSKTTGTGGNGGGGGGGGSNVAPPGAITVTIGTTTTGADITLPAPSASPAPNAKMIGVAVPVSGGTQITLTNAPAVIHLSTLPVGGQLIVAVTGDGLASGTGTSATSLVTSATLSGPADITVGATSVLTDPANGDKAVGVGLRITLGSSTATGARTIFLKNAQGDITAFSGGLEILL